MIYYFVLLFSNGSILVTLFISVDVVLPICAFCRFDKVITVINLKKSQTPKLAYENVAILTNNRIYCTYLQSFPTSVSYEIYQNKINEIFKLMSD